MFKDFSIVIAAGGLGTRLSDFRGEDTNKVLLEINGVPMIIQQINQLQEWGLDISKIICITNPLLHDLIQNTVRSYFSKDIKYVVQPEPLGIAHALSFAEENLTTDRLIFILGDNFFEINPLKDLEINNLGGANVFLKGVSSPQDFGVAEVEMGNVINIDEKPEKPKTNLAVVGLYVYSSDVFNRIKKLKPSNRGEFEITDLNKLYIDESSLKATEIKGWWIDAGTPERIIELEKHID
tara:strand:+ start:3965 stop:4678 length:714 start_codon:yes stop_codon:yes gene_type:complete